MSNQPEEISGYDNPYLTDRDAGAPPFWKANVYVDPDDDPWA